MNFNIFKIGVIAAATVFASSCSDSFLDEDLIRQKSTDYFKTAEGVNDLAAGAYIMFRFNYQYDWGVYLNQNGTDESSHGANGKDYDEYAPALNSSWGSFNTLWASMYGVVEWGNKLIANVPVALDKNSADYNTRLGEGYFMRAWAYYMLTSQFAGVPLQLEPSTGANTYFARNTEQECWAQIIADFKQAYDLLPDQPEAPGRLHKMAAAFYLSKACLFRASERCDAFNGETKASDLENVIKYGKEVIAKHPLAANYSDLWAYTGVNSPAEYLPEVVFSAQYDDVATHRDRYGNQAFLYQACQYFNLPGFKRDISGGREFNYAKPTEYTIAAFDRVNDSRFWKSFVTTYLCNNEGTAPAWSAADINAGLAPAGVKEGDKRFKNGEIGCKYIINEPGDTRYSAYVVEGQREASTALKNGKIEAAHTYVRYFSGDARNWNDFNNTQMGNNIHRQDNRGLTVSKYRDGSRETVASQFGNFDGKVARSAEAYLMVAEALVRQDKYQDALDYINPLRRRAGYESGEDRSAYIDGGIAYLNNPKGTGNADGLPSFCDKNTYYESNGDMAETTASTKSVMEFGSWSDCINNSVDKPILDRLNLGSDREKMINFILNERTRELYGEFVRWTDLSRTKMLEARFKAFSFSATRASGNFASRHNLRPIPQTFLDAITTSSGAALTDEEKDAMQNPGY